MPTRPSAAQLGLFALSHFCSYLAFPKTLGHSFPGSNCFPSPAPGPGLGLMAVGWGCPRVNATGETFAKTLGGAGWNTISAAAAHQPFPLLLTGCELQ